MTRRFTAQHTANGYAAMGGHKARPIIHAKTRTVQESIAHARRVAANQQKATKKKN